MKLRITAVLLFSLVVEMGPVRLMAQANDRRSASSEPRKKHAGFIEYALGRINPEQRDYGLEIADMRHLAVLSTVENVYFWFSVLSLSLLAGVTSMHLLHLRGDEKKELLVASLIAELWNGRVSDRIEIDRRTQKYDLLVAQKNTALEAAHDKEGEVAESSENPESRTQRKVERLVGSARPGARGQNAKTNLPEVALGVPAATDLAQQNMLLERRIEAMRNTEQNLRERLNQTTSQLEDERKRNRTLKGA